MSNKFDKYQRVGPLRLSLDRPMIGRRGALVLEGVAVNVKPPDDIWTSKNELLEKLGKPEKKSGK